MKQAMIFAAGLGTRLKPITDTKPKALVEVGGEPLLRRVISRLHDAGFTRIVVNVHHFAGQIIQYLQDNDNFGLDIRISDESQELLDTGGGIKHARQFFDPTVPVLIHNVDILSNVDLDRFYRLDPKMACPDCGAPHLKAAATLLVSQRVTQRYLVFDAQMRLVGWTNIKSGEVKTPFAWVREMLESPAVRDLERQGLTASEIERALLSDSGCSLRLLAFSGIHCFGPELFPLMEAYPDRFPIMDFYLQNCDKAFIRGYEKADLHLLDVGKLETLQEAEAFVKDM